LILEGRFAIVTGAGEGLGAEIARRMAAAGASLMLCARSADKLEQTRDSIASTVGGEQKILSRVTDVSVVNDVSSLIEATMGAFARIDILVNNAGVYGPFGRLEDSEIQEWTRAIEINLFGLVYCCRAVLPHMRKAGRGKIINLSGGGATAPLPGLSSYAAAKAAVVRLTETLALEAQDAGIDVNAIAPGALATRLLDEVIAAGPERVGAAFHQRMIKIRAEGGTPLELGAKLCVFLASSQSDGITGRLISAAWDRWDRWPEHLEELQGSDVYTLRRIAGRDRGMSWGDV
jgi:NAD(P)-dependent dehydrogenase (short-subunit alcohol dehydrogenase family)